MTAGTTILDRLARVIPEPVLIALMGLGLLALACGIGLMGAAWLLRGPGR